MKILVYTYFPLFDKHLAGGLQFFVREIVESLNKKGLDIEVVCPDSKLHDFPKIIKVHNIIDDLEVNGMTPNNYYNNLQKLKRLEQNADIIWTFDRSFPIKSNKKKVLSMQTHCYEKEMKAVFEDDYTKIVFLSSHQKQQYSECELNNVVIIPSMIDSRFFSSEKNLNKLSKYFNYDNTKKYILFPHRPEREKGHLKALEIIEKLSKKDNSYILMFPCEPDSRLLDKDAERNFVNEVKANVKHKNLSKHVIFHRWVDAEDMPEYLSIGEATLFLSELPETFGVSLVNSIVAGTPVISFGSGALKETVPPGNAHFTINKENYIDAAEIIQKGFIKLLIEEDKIFITKSYNLKLVTEKYFDLFQEIQRSINEKSAK